jgi:hypothetical protein
MSQTTEVLSVDDRAWQAVAHSSDDWCKGPRGVSRSPHRQSYRPDLPFDGSTGLGAWADGMVKRQAKRSPVPGQPWAWYEHDTPKAKWPHPQKKTVVQFNKAHPQSYRPDLPLHGATGAITATAADRKYWDAHPLVYTKAPDTSWHARYLAAIIDPRFYPKGYRPPTPKPERPAHYNPVPKFGLRCKPF